MHINTLACYNLFIHIYTVCIYIYVLYIYIYQQPANPPKKNMGKGEENPSQSHPTSCNLAMTIGSFKCFSASEPVHPTKSPELFGAVGVSGDSPDKLKHPQRDFGLQHKTMVEPVRYHPGLPIYDIITNTP